MAETFDPYRKWLGIPPEDQPPNHYRLLGIGLFESDPDVISNAADRQMAHLRTFQSGKHGALSQKLLNELSAARVCLLATEKKEEYDKQLRQRLAAKQPPPPPPVAPPPKASTVETESERSFPFSTEPAILQQLDSGLPLEESSSAIDVSQFAPEQETVQLRAQSSSISPLSRAAAPVEAFVPPTIARSAPVHTSRRKATKSYGLEIGLAAIAGAVVLAIVTWMATRRGTEPEPPGRVEASSGQKGGTSRSTGTKRHEEPKSKYSPLPPPKPKPGAFPPDSLKTPPLGGELPVLPTGPLSTDSVGEIRRFPGHSAGVLAAAFSSDGNFVITASYDKTVRVFNVLTGKEMRRFSEPTLPVLDVAVSPRDQLIAAVSGQLNAPQGSTLFIWRFTGGAPIARVELGAGKVARQLRFSADSKRLVLGLEDGSVRIFDSVKGEELHWFKGHTASVACVAWSGDNQWILSGGEDNSVRLWNAGTGEVRELKGPTQQVYGVAFSPSGKFVFAAGGDNTICQWDTTSGQSVRTITSPKGPVLSVDCSRDGRNLLSAGGNTVFLWDLLTGSQVQKFEGHQGPVLRVAISPAGRFAVSAGQDGTVRLWGLPAPGAGTSGLLDLEKPVIKEIVAAKPKPEAPKEEPEEAIPMVAGLACRQGPNQAALLKAFGGTAETEAAVKRALEWLAAHQRTDGSWNFDHNVPRCKGQCGNRGTLTEASNTATALALLAYLGAGHRGRGQGEFRRNVFTGVQYLVKHIVQVGGSSGSLQDADSGTIPSHAVATLALCEAAGMQRDKPTRSAAQMAVNFVAVTQQADGGWPSRFPRTSQEKATASDLRSTLWNMAVLQTAQWASLDVPKKNLARANEFLDALQTDDKKLGRIAFLPSVGASAADADFTGGGFLLRLYFGTGRARPEIQAHAEALAKDGPKADSPLEARYFNTLFLREYGGQPWHTWNAAWRSALLTQQMQEGHAAGSWFFKTSDGDCDRGGRLYCTAIAAMASESYYSHPPLFTEPPPSKSPVGKEKEPAAKDKPSAAAP